MYRIIHLSDMHLSASQFKLEDLLSPFGKGGESIDVISRLVTVVKTLQPKLIAVTGDLTDMGDVKSLEMAKEFLNELKNDSGAEQVICVPGNHDLYSSRFLTVIRRPFFNAVTTYLECMKEDFGALDPSNPVVVDTVWGRIALFLFNSNDFLFRDQGKISDDQYAAISRYIADCDDDEVRIALLHHHPKSAPSADLGIQQKLILMRDGTRFIENMKHAGFHIVMHGHQHTPFYSASWIETSPGRRAVSLLHVLAGGSATMSGSKPQSFNVLDILSPFEADFRRYDFDVAVRREFVEVASERRLLQLFDPSMKLAELNRKDKEEIELAESPRDSAATNLRRVLRPGIDEEHQYDLIEMKARIDKKHHYHGQQRRVGNVVVDESSGWKFVIVGEPGADICELHLNAVDNQTDTELKCEAMPDEPRRKVIRVFTTVPLKVGDHFDVTLTYQWPTTRYDPNDYDGFNLLYFKHQISKVLYEAEIPWRPARLQLWSCGARIRRVPVDWNWEQQTCRFELDKPLHSMYIIQIGEKPL